MPHYMIQAAYTPDAWGGLARNPQDRAESIRPVIEALGGKLVSFYSSFGEYGALVIVEMPDYVAAAAVSIAASAGGAVDNVRITSLMTIKEGMEAMRKAGEAGYRPPSQPQVLMQNQEVGKRGGPNTLRSSPPKRRIPAKHALSRLPKVDPPSSNDDKLR